MNVSVFLDDDALSVDNTVHFPDTTTAYWQSSSVSAVPLAVTTVDSVFLASQSYQLNPTVGTAGNYYATFCGQAATTVSVSVAVVDQLSSAPLPASVNGAAVTGTVAAGCQCVHQRNHHHCSRLDLDTHFLADRDCQQPGDVRVTLFLPRPNCHCGVCQLHCQRLRDVRGLFHN